MNIAVWIASGLLAAAYLFAGGTKLLTPKERLAKNPLVGAAVFHGRRAEYKQWPVNAVFLALAVFIAAARTSEVVR